MKKAKSFVSFSLASVMLFISCSQYDESVQSVLPKDKSILYKSVNNNNYSGEDIFRGIFFLEGDIVNKIPSLHNAKIERDILFENPILVSSMPEINESNIEPGLSNDSLVQKIREFNPDIFTELKESVLSENPYNVRDKLEESALLLRSALLTNNTFARSIQVITDGKTRGGIDPKNYDFTIREEVMRYNEDMSNFLENDPEYEDEFDRETSAVVIVFLITVSVLVAFVAYMFALIGGAIFVVMAAALWIYVLNWFENWSIGDFGQEATPVITDTINLFKG